MTAGDETPSRPVDSALATALAVRLTTVHGIRLGRRAVVGIAGESGSGKSETALGLAREMRAAGLRTLVLHQDDYFIRPPRANHEHRLLDLANVGSHEVNLSGLTAHIADFRQQRAAVIVPRVDYRQDRFVTHRVDFTDMDLLIVEGTYVLQLPDLDVRVFLSATHEDTAERRRVRARDLDVPVMHEILSIEHRLIAPQRMQADIVIDRHFVIIPGS